MKVAKTHHRIIRPSAAGRAESTHLVPVPDAVVRLEEALVAGDTVLAVKPAAEEEQSSVNGRNRERVRVGSGQKGKRGRARAPGQA